MKQYDVSISAEAEEHLFELWLYLEERFGDRAADSFIAQIRAACQGLSLAPLRGIIRPGLGKGIRVTGACGGRVSLLFHVGTGLVTVLDIRYAGWDREPLR